MQQAFSKITSSLKAVVLGVVLILLSVFLLFRVEGRENLAPLAEQAQSISEAAQDELVYLTGDLSSQSPAQDLFLAPGEYFLLDRTAQMYSWEENEQEEELPRYTYEQVWSENPEDSSTFNTDNYNNPAKTVNSQRSLATMAALGAYDLQLDKLRIPSDSDLNLTLATVSSESGIIDDNYLYLDASSSARVTQPEIGDIRLSYDSIELGEKFTVFGRIDDNAIIPHYDNSKSRLYRLFEGDKMQAVQQLENEYQTSGTIQRVLGFFMLWAGLFLVINPLTTVLSFVPVLGKAGNTALLLITGLIALIISVTVNLFSRIVHSPLGLILLIALIVAAGWWIWKRRQQKQN